MPHRIGWVGYVVAGFCLVALAAAAQTPDTQSAGSWRLVRSANPGGGSDAVSMARSADISSDQDLAGVMLRCHGQGASPEVVIVVVTPFPPRARPGVILGANGREWRFESQVVPPGAELLLPATAADLASGPWQSARQLTVRISWQGQSIGGVIPIDGLGSALATLAAHCPPPNLPSEDARER